MKRRSAIGSLALCGVFTAVQACASTPRATAGAAADPDSCAFEVVNQTTSSFDLFITSSQGPIRGTVAPGGRFAFERSCDIDRVVVTARPREGPRDFAGGERRRQTDVIEHTVAPRRDEVVQVSLRW